MNHEHQTEEELALDPLPALAELRRMYERFAFSCPRALKDQLEELLDEQMPKAEPR